MELAGLRCDNIGLRYHRHGGRQPGRTEDLQGTKSIEDCFYNAW